MDGIYFFKIKEGAEPWNRIDENQSTGLFSIGQGRLHPTLLCSSGSCKNEKAGEAKLHASPFPDTDSRIGEMLFAISRSPTSLLLDVYVYYVITMYVDKYSCVDRYDVSQVCIFDA